MLGGPVSPTPPFRPPSQLHPPFLERPLGAPHMRALHPNPQVDELGIERGLPLPQQFFAGHHLFPLSHPPPRPPSRDRIESPRLPLSTSGSVASLGEGDGVGAAPPKAVRQPRSPRPNRHQRFASLVPGRHGTFNSWLWLALAGWLAGSEAQRLRSKSQRSFSQTSEFDSQRSFSKGSSFGIRYPCVIKTPVDAIIQLSGDFILLEG